MTYGIGRQLLTSSEVHFKTADLQNEKAVTDLLHSLVTGSYQILERYLIVNDQKLFQNKILTTQRKEDCLPSLLILSLVSDPSLQYSRSIDVQKKTVVGLGHWGY